jgi:hypothetical protein
LRKLNGQWASALEVVGVFAPHDWFSMCAQHGLLDRLMGTMEDIQDF